MICYVNKKKPSFSIARILIYKRGARQIKNISLSNVVVGNVRTLPTLGTPAYLPWTYNPFEVIAKLFLYIHTPFEWLPAAEIEKGNDSTFGCQIPVGAIFATETPERVIEFVPTVMLELSLV